MTKRTRIRRKLVTGIMVANTALGAFGGVLLVQPRSVSAAEVLGSAVADNTSARSITIWKYQIKDSSELGNPGTGEIVPTDKTPLAGIKFKVERVKALNGASLTDPIKVSEGTDYEIDGSFEAETLTTGSDGSAKLELGVGRSVDGIYLVTELPDDRGTSPSVAKPTDPFFVYVPQTKRDDRSTLIYDVEVQPKNILESLINPDKTIEGGKGYSIKAGQSFDWEATASIPAGLFSVAAQDMVITPLYDDKGEVIPAPNDSLAVSAGTKVFADYFKMSDTLDQELELLNVVVQVRMANQEWLPLTLGEDYTTTVNGTEITEEPITAAPGTANAVQVSLIQPVGDESPAVGMEKVQAYDQIRVIYTTKTAVDYNGTIANAFDVAFKVPGLKPVDPTSIVDPESYTGGFDIEKLGEDTQAALAGAVFYLAESKSDAETFILLGADGKRYGKADGTGTLAEAIEAASAAGTTLLKSTSDNAGKATFNGLALNWFTDANDNGQQDLDEPTYVKTEIKKSYWIIETTAPAGYELLKEVQEVVVSLSTKETIQLTVIDKKTTDLPFTGGQGAMLVVVIAVGAISVGAIAITIDKKRRRA